MRGIVRMDADTTGGKDAHAQILGKFRRGDVDIWIGTQMIAKGLDFSEVTLVGVIYADLSLQMPDFRAARAHGSSC
jgi:primosomal protein N' (replication factor Y)